MMKNFFRLNLNKFVKNNSRLFLFKDYFLSKTFIYT
jgi:hypothetical protein